MHACRKDTMKATKTLALKQPKRKVRLVRSIADGMGALQIISHGEADQTPSTTILRVLPASLHESFGSIC